MAHARCPFEVLGVSPEDDMPTIRMAWLAKVRLLHPDFAMDKARATDELATVNAAFDALQGHTPNHRVRATAPKRPKRRPLIPRARPVAQTGRDIQCVKPALARTTRAAWSGPADRAARLRAIEGYAQARKVVAPA